MSFWEESQVGNFIFWRFGLFLFCLFWRAFLFFGQAAHHGFVFGYSQRLVMGFLEGTNTFSLGMPWRTFAASVFFQKIIANKSSIYLRETQLKSIFMRHFRTREARTNLPVSVARGVASPIVPPPSFGTESKPCSINTTN